MILGVGTVRVDRTKICDPTELTFYWGMQDNEYKNICQMVAKPLGKKQACEGVGDCYFICIIRKDLLNKVNRD